MDRKVLLGAMALLFLLASPGRAQAQITISWIFSPPPNADFLVMGGVAIPVVKVDRLRAGVGLNVGGIWDNADPGRNRHSHLTWMPTIPVTFRIGRSWGLVAGYGWGFVKKDAKPHLSNYQTLFAGVAFGL
ncbi:MAG: hypothetical protein KW802_04245 [Candidatus Doudnabacteria bacterium]|nr:hypothetical protein [Candidatus Doudnabacteria bacterium]